MKIANQTRIRVIKSYLAKGSLRKTSALFGVHRNTLWRWLKWYEEGGFTLLTERELFLHPWNRLPKKIEEKVYSLKENKPCMTIRAAKAILKKQGIEISTKSIWSIWKRYGFTGFQKNKISTIYQAYVAADSFTPEKIRHIEEMINRKHFNQAAKVINDIPFVSNSKILAKIPAHLLSLRHQVNQLASQYDVLPLSVLRKRATMLRRTLAKKKMFYSWFRTGIEEGYTLIWLGMPRELLQLTRMLKKKANRIRDPGLCFILLLFEGHALGSLLKIPETLKCTRQCKAIIRRIRHPHQMMAELAGVYSIAGYFREATHLLEKALPGVPKEYEKQLITSLAGFYNTAGEYQEAAKILKEGKAEGWDYRSRALIVDAFTELNRGEFENASSYAVTALRQAEKEEIKRYLHLATFVLACGHAALGRMAEAKSILKRYLPLLKRYRLKQEYYLRKILLGNVAMPKGAFRMPILRLANLMHQASKTKRARDYRRVLTYARTNRLFGVFERVTLFFPTCIQNLLKKGKNPGLPQVFLEIPVFRINPPVYTIKLLGIPVISRFEKQPHRLQLKPKDTTFLLHMAMNKKHRILQSKLHDNFWSRSKRPSRNLSQLLVRIRKKLGLPRHLLAFQGEHLVWKFYCTTDYESFEESAAQAHALVKVGEWSFARREYLRAFSLFRGEPFRKMYDNWSEDMRRVIINKLETELKNFEKGCREHKDMKTYSRVLRKIKKFVLL